MSKLNFKYEMVHTEKFTDKEGKEGKKYTKIGAVFERDDGSMCAKVLDSWVNFYEPRANASDYKKLKDSIKPETPNLDDLDDEIPF